MIDSEDRNRDQSADQANHMCEQQNPAFDRIKSSRRLIWDKVVDTLHQSHIASENRLGMNFLLFHILEQFLFLIYLSLKNRKFHHWSRRNRPLNSLNGYYEEVDQKWKNLIVFFNKCQTYVGNGLNTLFFKS